MVFEVFKAALVAKKIGLFSNPSSQQLWKAQEKEWKKLGLIYQEAFLLFLQGQKGLLHRLDVHYVTTALKYGEGQVSLNFFQGWKLSFWRATMAKTLLPHSFFNHLSLVLQNSLTTTCILIRWIFLSRALLCVCIGKNDDRKRKESEKALYFLLLSWSGYCQLVVLLTAS